MVRFRPLRIGLFPLQMAFLRLMNGGDPNHLLSGMILQVIIGERWMTAARRGAEIAEIAQKIYTS